MDLITIVIGAPFEGQAKDRSLWSSGDKSVYINSWH